ncbi:MAG: DUF934 domain-containing protein [Bermanella sp.]
MQKLINDTGVLDDNWTLVEDIESELPSGNILVPAPYWLDNRDALDARGNVGIWLASDVELAPYLSLISSLPLIAIHFPAFANGRGYSLARLVKERSDFSGELRAIGDVLLDQLFFMRRCGFDSYLLKDGLSGQKALDFFSTFTDPYQLANDLPEPLFRRKHTAA